MENGIDQIAELNKNPAEPADNPRANNKKVAYYYDHDVGNFNYGLGHPMKPHRMRMTHNLLTNYGVLEDMDVFRPTRSTHEQLTRFHTDEYIEFLQRVTPETVEELTGSGSRFLVGDDCPAFEGVYEFCTISAGGSISAAQRLNSGAADTCINWAGGLHHAKKREASGFCYVNDIVLAVLELLRFHPRVLYIDIDVHHGDGVEEAFYSTDRVMTCSFHKFGDFFPGTGDVRDVGIARGKNYAVNIPLRDGITDEAYKSIFEPVIQRIMDWFRPGAVILQCGADSLAGDKLGMFNLSMKGHADCVRFLNSFNVPLMLVGGGGYTTKNVARTWTYETGVVLGKELDENLPYNDYLEYFGPRFKLEVMSSNMENQNTKEYLDNIRTRVFEALRSMPFAPSAGMQEVPKKSVGQELGFLADDDDSGDESDIDRQINQRIRQIHDAQSRSKAGSWRDNGDSDSDSRMDTDEEDGRSQRSRPAGSRGHQASRASSSHSHAHSHGQQQPVASSSRYTPGTTFSDALASNFSARRGQSAKRSPQVVEPYEGGLGSGLPGARRKRSFFAQLPGGNPAGSLAALSAAANSSGSAMQVDGGDNGSGSTSEGGASGASAAFPISAGGGW